RAETGRATTDGAETRCAARAEAARAEAAERRQPLLSDRDQSVPLSPIDAPPASGVSVSAVPSRGASFDPLSISTTPVAAAATPAPSPIQPPMRTAFQVAIASTSS